jgi:hypothetical protein
MKGEKVMNKNFRFLPVIYLFAFSILACGLFGSSSSYSEPTAPITPITVGSDLNAVDLCRAIPQEDIEAVMGRQLVSAPEKFEYYDTPGTSGCSYDAGKDPDGTAYFGYVVLTSIEVYGDQPLYNDKDVSGIGQEAYFNNGADARQLWVKVNDQVAFVVAFGDVPNEKGAQAIAKLMMASIQ